MYELIEKKNNYKKILIWAGFLIFAGALYFEISEGMRPHIDEKLVKIANDINSHTPIIIDSNTRLDNVTALTGKIFSYNYSLINSDPTQIDTTNLIRISKESMLNRLKTFPQAKFFRDNKIELRVNFTDEKYNYLCHFTIIPGEY